MYKKERKELRASFLPVDRVDGLQFNCNEEAVNGDNGFNAPSTTLKNTDCYQGVIKCGDTLWQKSHCASPD